MATPKERRNDPTGPVVFVVFTVIGVAYIIAAKWLHADAVLVTLVPVLLMVGYALAIWAFRALRLRSDQSGDNFYYMGFIFTLTSLSLTLIQYSDGANAAEIVRNFGVAVGSTIAGIVLRIVFNLFRRDPMEVEEQTRYDLSQAAQKVQQELSGVALEMQHFGRAQQQMLLEAYEDLHAQLAASTAASEEVVQEMTRRLEAQLASEAQAGTIARVRSELETTAVVMAVINERLGGISQALSVGRGGLGQAVRSERPPWWRRLAFWRRGVAPAMKGAD